jgi:hypothetical protein
MTSSLRNVGQWAAAIVTTAVLLLSSSALCLPSPELALPAEKQPVARNQKPPRVWIFVGLPGDAERLDKFRRITQDLVSTFGNRYGTAQKDVSVLFGAGDVEPYEACTSQTLTRELSRICDCSKDPGPIWVLFLGHSNSATGGVRFNVSGEDPSARDIGEKLSKAAPGADIVLFVATEAGGKYLKDLAAPGRIVVCSQEADVKDNEPIFSDELATALADPQTDSDGDGFVSVLELFLATSERVKGFYESEKLIQTEKALLDGDGDGRGTALPSEKDAAPARERGLKVSERRSAWGAPHPPNPQAGKASRAGQRPAAQSSLAQHG